jgi:hypothetical protein
MPIFGWLSIVYGFAVYRRNFRCSDSLAAAKMAGCAIFSGIN